MDDINLDQEVVTTTNDAAEAVEAQVAPTEQAAVVDTPPKAPTIDEAVRMAAERLSKNAEAEKPAAVAPPVQPVAPGPKVDPITGKPVELVAVPYGASALLKEKWDTIDPALQRVIADREREISTALVKSGAERNLANEFKQIVTPYEPVLSKLGRTAPQLTKELFEMSAVLVEGNSQAKAKLLYDLIIAYKPDPATLQQLFSGQQVTPSQAPPPVNVQSEVERVLEARENQAMQRQLDGVLAAFEKDPANEFFPHVRELMGKAIDAGFVNGDTAEELFANAYAFACGQHPEVKLVLSQRQAAAPAVPSAAPAAPAVKPVGSVKPSLGGDRGAKKPAVSMTLDEAVAAAAKKHGVGA